MGILDTISNFFITTTNPKKFVYLEPRFKSTSFILVAIIIGVFIWLILLYNYILKNWDDVKCEKGRFYIAPLFGKNSQKTFEECVRKDQEEALNKSLSGVNKKISAIDDKINELSDMVGTTKKSNIDVLTNTIQSNLLYVKDALSKIMGSILLSSYMNEGAITSIQSLDNSTISKMVSKFNEVVPMFGNTPNENI
jgi:hypothetical protein